MKEFIIYEDSSGQWIAESKKLPGFIAKGRTREEAVEKMKRAFRIYYPCGDCGEK